MRKKSKVQIFFCRDLDIGWASGKVYKIYGTDKKLPTLEGTSTFDEFLERCKGHEVISE